MPQLRRVVITRNVRFNKTKFYSLKKEKSVGQTTFTLKELIIIIEEDDVALDVGFNISNIIKNVTNKRPAALNAIIKNIKIKDILILPPSASDLALIIVPSLIEINSPDIPTSSGETKGALVLYKLSLKATEQALIPYES